MWALLAVLVAGIAVEVVFAWACAMIAKTKGYSPWLWGVLAFFFFGVLILIVVVLLPTKTPREDGSLA